MALTARDVIAWCRRLAQCSEEPGRTTRTFLSPPMRDVHRLLSDWMGRVGMQLRTDNAGNLRGVRRGTSTGAPRLYVGSHLDTVPNAGAFDGILGVVMGIALVEALGARPVPFDIEVIGFSEEEGVRFGQPFIGSRAFAGTLDAELLNGRDAAGQTVADAIRAYGLDPMHVENARAEAAIGYLEFHVEQGPVLDRLGLPLGVVDAIAGQSRMSVWFEGAANHAGTTPMDARRDALAGAAEWIILVERRGLATPGLVATVGRVEASPGAGNVIAGSCRATLDIRHADDRVRAAAVQQLVAAAHGIAARRGLTVSVDPHLDQPAVAMDATLTSILHDSVACAGYVTHHMTSGAGHDAMIVASQMPAAMLFLRSPGGISHHPDESVTDDAVTGALAAGLDVIEILSRRQHG